MFSALLMQVQLLSQLHFLPLHLGEFAQVEIYIRCIHEKERKNSTCPGDHFVRITVV